MNAHLILALVALTATCLVLWAVAEYRLDRAFADLGDAEDRIDLQARVIETLIAEREKGPRTGSTWNDLGRTVWGDQ